MDEGQALMSDSTGPTKAPAREWIFEGCLGLRDRANSPPGNYIFTFAAGPHVELNERVHVIERSALTECERKLDVARRALEFYGAKENWSGLVDEGIWIEKKNDWDRGTTAREALEEIS